MRFLLRQIHGKVKTFGSEAVRFGANAVAIGGETVNIAYSFVNLTDKLYIASL